jgi:hypothetical protein
MRGRSDVKFAKQLVKSADLDSLFRAAILRRGTTFFFPPIFVDPVLQFTEKLIAHDFETSEIMIWEYDPIALQRQTTSFFVCSPLALGFGFEFCFTQRTQQKIRFVSNVHLTMC